MTMEADMMMGQADFTQENLAFVCLCGTGAASIQPELLQWMLGARGEKNYEHDETCNTFQAMHVRSDKQSRDHHV